MFVKFNKALADIDYIIGFDLALYNTGVCVYDIKDKKMVSTLMISVDKAETQPAAILYEKIIMFLEMLKAAHPMMHGAMILQEQMPQQAGFHTTVATLQGLAKAHAMLELAVYQTDGFEFYDEKGIHSVSVKALFKTDEIQKPTKTDIKKVVSAYYGYKMSDLTDDQSDSMALIYTLLNKKWNADIIAKIKEEKKEIKSLKMQKAIEERQEKITWLEQLKI